MNYSQFLRERLFYQSDNFLLVKTDRLEFEQLTMRLIPALDLANGLNRDRILLSASDFLTAEKVDDRKKSLVLSLLDSGLEIVKATETFRDRVIAELRHEIEDLDCGEEIDRETIDELGASIHELKDNNFEVIYRTLADKHGLEGQMTRAVSPFESAFIRNEFREHHRSRKGGQWERFRARLGAMFGLSKMQIAAVKSWEAETLRERGGRTVDELITEIRQRIESNLSEGNNKPGKAAGETVNGETLDKPALYAKYIPAEDLPHVVSLEPPDYIPENGKITPMQRRWIFALILCAKMEDRRAVRRHLASDIFRCPIAKIAAVSAYLTGGCRKRASDEVRADMEVTEGHLKKNPLNDDAAETKKETAEFHPVSPVAMETEGFTPGSTVKEETVESPPEPTAIQDAPAIQAVSEGGEHFDYDNETKRAWRKKVQEFVAAHTDADKRANMRVLCMPGKRCLEIPLYLELGFRPHNIVGVEGGDAGAREEFSRAARVLKIDSRAATLEEILPKEKRSFDVVNLDFTGPWCDRYRKILPELNLSDESIFLVNVMAKRESRKTSRLFKLMNAVRESCDDDEKRKLLEAVATDGGEAPGEISEVRDSMTVLQALMMLGAYRSVAAHPFPGRIINIRDKGLYPSDILIPKIILENIMPLLLQLGVAPETAIKSCRTACRMWDRLSGTHFFVLDHKGYKYDSEPNNSRFISDFYFLRNNAKTASACRDALDFLFRCLESSLGIKYTGKQEDAEGKTRAILANVIEDPFRASIKNHNAINLKMMIRDHKGRSVSPRDRLPLKKLSFAFLRDDGRVAASLPVRVFLRDTAHFDAVTADVSFDDYLTIGTDEREMIKP